MNKVLFLFFTVFLFVSNSYSITIDEFEGGHALSASGGETVSETFQAPLSINGDNTAIGAYRTFEIEGINGSTFLKTHLINSLGFASHSQDSGATGISHIIWDGDNVNALNPVGLNGVDFTQDGSTAFVLTIRSFDAPAGQPVTLEIYAYSGTEKISKASYTISSVINSPTDISLPFSSLIKNSTNAADITSISAIELVILGTSEDTDLSIEWFGTDACRIVPDSNNRVVDECGVCGGDNSTCLDCNGLPNGSATMDRCGICLGDGASCLGCQELDQTDKLKKLDGGAKKQEKHIKKLAKQLLKIDRSEKIMNRIKRQLIRTHRLQITNWTLSWTLPRQSNSCSNDEFCSSISVKPILDEYRIHSEELRVIGVKIGNKIKKFNNGLNKRHSKMLAKNNNLHFKNMELADTIPLTQSSCT